MSEVEQVAVAAALALMVMAAAAGWCEARVEAREEPAHRRVLRANAGYREHVARGPAAERRKARRGRGR